MSQEGVFPKNLQKNDMSQVSITGARGNVALCQGHWTQLWTDCGFTSTLPPPNYTLGQII